MTTLKPHKGRLLIAEPSILNDSSFNRSIVLLTEHTNKNSIGFIINKPMKHTLNDLIPNIDCDFTVYQGGPVEQDNLYFIHKIPDLLPNSTEVANGIYWGGDFSKLTLLLNEGLIQENEIRFFLGYSGWAENQLNQELKEESWFIIENTYNNILSCPSNCLWKDNLLELGGRYKIWANAPTDPSLN